MLTFSVFQWYLMVLRTGYLETDLGNNKAEHISVDSHMIPEGMSYEQDASIIPIHISPVHAFFEERA